MQPPKDSSPPRIDFFCPVEKLFLSLEKIQSGSSLPENVIADINPFQHQPATLPEDVWFFVRPGENARTNFGVWKIKEEFCGLFSNQFITGCQTTFEYYEGQAPDALKTDWLMQEYWIIQKKIREDCTTKEASSLFKVFLGSEDRQNHDKMQKMFALNLGPEENHPLSQQSVSPAENSPETSDSTSNSQASKEAEAMELRVERKISETHNQHVDDVDESEYLSRGDFLELRDLDIPPSPTSSSENSSCMTMTSDECFDSLDLFPDIEPEISPDLVRRDKSTTAAPLRINEGAVHPSFSVLSDEIVEATPSSSQRNQNKQQLNRRGGLSTDSSNSSASTSSDSATDGDTKARGKRVKKRLRNCLCFIPF